MTSPSAKFIPRTPGKTIYNSQICIYMRGTWYQMECVLSRLHIRIRAAIYLEASALSQAAVTLFVNRNPKAIFITQTGWNIEVCHFNAEAPQASSSERREICSFTVLVIGGSVTFEHPGVGTKPFSCFNTTYRELLCKLYCPHR